MILSKEVECDEAYVVAGHKGQPEVVQNKGRKGRRNRLKGKCGRGTLAEERPPVFGMIQRVWSSGHQYDGQCEAKDHRAIHQRNHNARYACLYG